MLAARTTGHPTFRAPDKLSSLALSCLIITLMAVFAASPAVAESAVRSDQAGGIYDKPYLNQGGKRVSVGGYLDMEFEWNEGDGSTFDQHRFIPFITGYVSERVTVSAEIEFEHGGQVKNGGGDGEIKLEYAVMDFKLNPSLGFRGGVILSPLGSFNLLHDSPLNDVTARPVVARQLMPSTLSEAGMGFFGDRELGEEGVVSYQFYLVNGFDEGVINSDGQLRVRGGRGSQKADNNRSKAFTGRLGYSPSLGTNFGASLHTGKYDPDDDLNLTISALDARWTAGPLEFQAEAARVKADIDRDLNPVTAQNQRGAYVQFNYHVLHDRLLPGSVVTLVARGDWVDYDTDRHGDSEEGITFGANFRPTEETVFKLDYNLRKTTALDGEKSKAKGRFFFSLATYF